MNLHKLLTDRPAINILKVLHDYEASNKNAYTMKLSDVCSRLNFGDIDSSVLLLAENGLIGMDTVSSEKILSISQKGKDFIKIFDQLVELSKKEKSEPQHKTVRLVYELTILEKKILVMAAKISKEIGMNPVAVKTLTQELYPYEAYEKKVSTVSRYISKLEELKLVERRKEGRESYVTVTKTGFRTIKEQLLEGSVQK